METKGNQSSSLIIAGLTIVILSVITDNASLLVLGVGISIAFIGIYEMPDLELSGILLTLTGLAALSLFAISPEITSKSPEISLAIGIIPILEGVTRIAKALGKERQASVIIALFALIPVVLYVIVDTNEMLFLMGLLVTIINAVNMWYHQKPAKSHQRHV